MNPRICIADAWIRAFESIKSMQLNETEITRVIRAYQVLLDRWSTPVESSLIIDGDHTACHRTHLFIDDSHIIGTAISNGQRPPVIAWHYKKPKQDSVPLFEFTIIEILATTMTLAFNLHIDLVKELADSNDLRY